MHCCRCVFFWLLISGGLLCNPARADLADALDLPAGTQITSVGEAPWFAQSTITHDGVDAAQSGAGSENQDCSLSLTVNGPQDLSFFWKLTSSDQGSGLVVFYLDGVESGYIQPSQDWNQRHYDIPAGSHTLEWYYTDLISSEESTAWLDQVVLTPVIFHSVTFDLGKHGSRIGGGELMQSVRAGTGAIAPTVSAEAGWAFTGWDLSFDAVTTAMTVTALYVVPTPPVISDFPQPRVLPSGSSASLSVTATSNAPLDYQWYRGETGDTSAPIPGATGPLLVTPALTASARFWVRVANAAGTVDTPASSVTITPRVGHILRGFGSTAYGRLGNGYPGFAAAPSLVDADVSVVSAGQEHTVFVKTNGSLWGMGNNSQGQLGIATLTSAVPVPIATGVTTVATGLSHTLFVKTDGTLWAMGNNRFGQLGDGSTTTRSTPVLVAAGVVAVSAGYYHSLFIKTDGSLWAMGYNYAGQLGDGGTSSSPGADHATPIQVATGVTAVSAGGYQTRYIKTDGTLWAAGGNYRDLALYPPAQIATDVAAVCVGLDHVLFVKTNGSLWASGDNYYGQLGDGTTTTRTSPVPISTGVASVAAGSTHSLFIKTDGTLWAMGANDTGQLGDGSTTDRHLPVIVATGVSHGAAGAAHSLFIKTDATLHATGDNRQDQLGDGRAVQMPPLPIATDVATVSTGPQQTLFVKTDGTLWATGANDEGQFADGTRLGRATPGLVASGVASVALGASSSRILKTDGSLWITHFQYTGYPNPPPPTLDLIGTDVASVAPGLAWHTLFIRSDASLWAVGSNDDGQLGDGTLYACSTPVSITTGVAIAAVGLAHSAFIKTDGSLWTMGLNYHGQLGDGTALRRLTPVCIAQGVVAVATGPYHTLFLKADGTLWATGENFYGQLGDGTVQNRSTPALIATGVTNVAAGPSHTFFRTNDGSLWAMGDNRYGQLGDGTFISRATPVRIGNGIAAASAGSGFSFVLTPSAYSAWAALAGLTGADAAHAAEPGADPDADGTPNMLEYAFGTSPVAADSAASRPGVALATVVGDQPALALTHRRRKAAALNYTYQQSSDLVTWTSVVVTPVVINLDADGDGLVELVTVTIPLGADPGLFLRVAVTE
jgi:alpha-tubulin suppressor-like RCC1 family protein